MITWTIVLLAIFIGMLTPVQAGVNAHLGKLLAHPFHAAFVSFLGGILTISIVCLITGKSFPTPAKLTSLPPYLLCGGLIGCVFVVTTIYIAPKLGATLYIACVVTGQLAASLLIDHYGWLGFAVHPISVVRLLGIACLFAGVVIIKFF